MTLRLTQANGYGGDVIQFYETETAVYAIHRLWRLNPKQRRELRIKDPDAKNHVITMGCINLDPEVYEKLKSCCTIDTLVIER